MDPKLNNPFSAGDPSHVPSPVPSQADAPANTVNPFEAPVAPKLPPVPPMAQPGVNPFEQEPHEPTPMPPIDLQQSTQNLMQQPFPAGEIGSALGGVAGGLAGSAGLAAVGETGLVLASGAVLGAGALGALGSWAGDNLMRASQLPDEGQREKLQRAVYRGVVNMVGEGAAQTVLGAVSIFAKSKIERDLINGLAKRGTEYELAAATERYRVAQAHGIDLTAEQLFPNDPVVAAEFKRIMTKFPEVSKSALTQNMDMIHVWERAMINMGRKPEGYKFSQYIEDVQQTFESEITGLQSKAIGYARDRQFIDESKAILDSIEQKMIEHGFNPNMVGKQGYKVPADMMPLHNIWLNLKNQLARSTALGETTAGHVPAYDLIPTGSHASVAGSQEGFPLTQVVGREEVASGSSPAAAHVQDQFVLPGMAEHLMPTPTKEGLMLQKVPARKPVGLGEQVTTQMGSEQVLGITKAIREGIPTTVPVDVVHSQEGLQLMVKSGQLKPVTNKAGEVVAYQNIPNSVSSELLGPNVGASQGESGLTLTNIERLRKQVEKIAGFHKTGDLTPGEQAAQRAYGAIREVRNSVNAKVFQDAGDTASGSQLEFYRKMSASERDTLDELQRMVASRPVDSWREIMAAKNPAIVKDFYTIAPPSVQKQIKAAYLDNIGDPFIKAGQQDYAVPLGAKGMSKQWDEIPKDLKNHLYTPEEQKTINEVLMLGRAIEARPLNRNANIIDPTDLTGPAKRLFTLMSQPKAEVLIHGNRFMTRLLAKSPALGDMLEATSAAAGNPVARYYTAGKAARIADAISKYQIPLQVGTRGAAQGGLQQIGALEE